MQTSRGWSKCLLSMLLKERYWCDKNWYFRENNELMNKNTLRNELKKKGVPQDLYDLSGGLPNEAYCLNKNDGIWEVYYSEKGIKSGLKTFSSEGDACNYFLGIVAN